MAMHVTQEDFKALRHEVREAKWLSFLVLQQLVGKQKAKEGFDSLQRFIERREEWARFDRGTPVFATAGSQYEALLKADLYTLEEVAAKPRGEVAAIRGIGPRTLARLDAELADRGLSWTEA